MEKRNKNHMLLYFVLILISQLLFEIGYQKMLIIESKIWLTSYNSEEVITTEMVYNLQKINMHAKNKIAFVAWTEKKDENVYQKDLNKTTDTVAIFSTERVDILFPECRPFDSLFQKTCIISSALAYELFGFKNVKGQQIIYKENEYIISDIIENKNKLCIFYDEFNRTYGEITVLCDFTRSQKIVKGVLEERMGINLKILDYRFWGFIYNVLFSLLCCSMFIFLFKQIKNMVPVLQGRMKKEDKINVVLTLLLVLINCLIFSHLSGIPVDIIPTKFSDESFWIKLIDEQKDNLRFLWMKEKLYPVVGWFQGKLLACAGMIMGGICWDKYKMD